MIWSIIWTLLAAFAGWLLADMISGFVHWFEDNFGSEDWPILGPLVIAPNRLHHANPTAFARDGTFLSRASTGTAFSLLLGLVMLFAIGPSVTLAVAVLGGCLANEVHLWAHRPLAAPGFVRAFQRIGLLQSLPHHAMHHRNPFDRNYCILTNWLNPVIERIGLWAFLDGLVAFVRRPH